MTDREILLDEVQPHHLENMAIVDALLPHLKVVETLTKGEWSIGEVINQTRARDITLFVAVEDKRAIKAIMGVGMIKLPNMEQMADILFLAGKGRQDWYHLLPLIERRLSEQGTNIMKAAVRKGMQKEMHDQGYKTVRYVVEKDITQ